MRNFVVTAGMLLWQRVKRKKLLEPHSLLLCESMPLLISEKDVKWCQTPQKIKIIIPLQSHIDAKTSVLLTTHYLKINSPPWFWECFLCSAVEPTESNAIIEDNRVSFELKKKISGIWKNLEDENKSNKTFCKERRQQAFEENKKRLEDDRETNDAKKQEINSASVRKQMQLNSQERERIEREKSLENERVAAEIERLRREQQKANEIALKRKQIEQSAKELPPTRRSGHITVTFTPRVFPTAARESQEADEREWLENQASAAVKLKLDCSDLSPEERNPEWLKEKAESLLKKKDYKGAINAYSLAIRMCPNMHSLYLGRSKCHLQLRNLHKCLEDSSKALELLVPPVASNAGDRVECHKIRGTALHQLELSVEGLMDIEAALKISPKDEDLKEKAEELRNSIQNADG